MALLDRATARLDRAKRARDGLSPDARALLDAVVSASGVPAVLAAALLDEGEIEQRTPRFTGSELSARLGWSNDRTKLAALELVESGCVATEAMGDAN